jgi:hypothetical protein
VKICIRKRKKMKAIYLLSMVLSLIVSADQYDPKVIRHVDGLVKAMRYEFSTAIDQESGSNDQANKKTLGNNKYFMPGMYGMYGMGYGMGYGGMYGGMYGMYPYYGYGGWYGGMDANPWTIWKRSTESSANDDLKQEIKADFDDQVIKPFRRGALKIVQGQVDAFNAGYSLKKRNAESVAGGSVAAEGVAKGATQGAAGANVAAKVSADAASVGSGTAKGVADSAGGFLARMRGRFASMSSGLMKLFGDLWKRFVALQPLGKAGVVALGLLSVTALVWWLRALFTKRGDEEIYE